MALKPHILSSNHFATFTAMGNAVIVDSGQVFLLEDVRIETARFPESRRIFQPSLGRVYHIRFSLNGYSFNSLHTTKLTFYMVDAADADYNPSSIDPFSIPDFKHKNDDIFLAIVDMANGLTITPIFNDREEGGGGSGTSGEILAADVVVTPSGNIDSTNLGDVLHEIDVEHALTSHVHPDLLVIGESLSDTNTVNGTNATFATSRPFVPGSTCVTQNGLRVKRGARLDAVSAFQNYPYDYFELGNGTIRFIEAPWVDDEIIVDYVKQ